MRMRLVLLVFVLLTCAACSTGQKALSSAQPGEIYLAALETSQATPEPTATALVASLTPTLLPTPELPTPESTLPLFETWSSQPTYLEESLPGLDFRVLYDSSRWALISNESGMPALVHRIIPYCQIVPTGGRGLPRGWVVESTFREIGGLQFEVAVASQEGQIKFVNYFGRANGIVTGFQVSFLEQMEDCLADAEVIFATLTSVPAATPTPSPTPTSDASTTLVPVLDLTPTP